MQFSTSLASDFSSFPQSKHFSHKVWAFDPCFVVLLCSHSRSAGPEGGVEKTSADVDLAVGVGLVAAGVGILIGVAGAGCRATCCPKAVKGGVMSS